MGGIFDPRRNCSKQSFRALLKSPLLQLTTRPFDEREISSDSPDASMPRSAGSPIGKSRNTMGGDRRAVILSMIVANNLRGIATSAI